MFYMFYTSRKKVLLSFTIISGIAATTRIAKNKIRTNFLIKLSLKQNSVWILYGDWNTTLWWQKLKLFCTYLSQLNNKPNIDGFTKTDFHELLTVTMPWSLVLFDGEYYKRIDGAAMGSPLGPTFANIFLSYYEQIWLKMCPS